MIIRQEEERDYHKVYSVVKSAFANAEHRDGNEQDLVAALRTSRAFLPKLSLVAEIDGKIAGHILFTKAKIGTHTELILAPLSVLPKNQRQGVGSALIREGHRIAEESGYQYCIVLGSEKYYPKFGYVPADKLFIQPPFEVPRENFMAVRLVKNAKTIRGIVEYASEFGI